MRAAADGCSGTPAAAAAAARASSHMDAPLITLDDAANTTDVYAFVSQRFGRKYLTTALAVYPHEEPGIGPNKYNFDDDVLYEIRVATGNDVAKGRTTYAYQFKFDTTFRNRNTILQSYLGVIANVGDASQNLDPAVHGGQGGLAAPGSTPARDAASCRPTTRGTPRRSTTGTTTANSPPRMESPPKPSWTCIRRNRSPSSRTGTSPLPVSATTGSTPTFKPSSIC